MVVEEEEEEAEVIKKEREEEEGGAGFEGEGPSVVLLETSVWRFSTLDPSPRPRGGTG